MYSLDDLNSEQLKITYDTDGPILVSAGAGSGKTRLLTHRIAYLIDKLHVSPRNILAITFTNKATKEMQQRLFDMCGTTDIWISTFHSMCAKILRTNISNLKGFTSNFTIYDDSDRTKVLKQVVKANLPNDEDILDCADFHISNAKNMGLNPQEYAQECSFLKEIDSITLIYSKYEENLQLNNALDFDDLQLKTLELLRYNKNVLEYYQNLFRYIHVDEFQDTNLVQYKIIKLLASKNHNVFVVGDEDQSIYGWRGATIGNIQSFITDNNGCKVYKLEQNYRSTKNIIDSANKLIKHNHSRIDKTLFTNNEEGEKVSLYSAYDEQEEGDFIARKIHELVNNGVKCSDIAVLMRISALSRIVEEKLLNYNIPYVVSGVFKFFERLEIKNIMAYMNVIVNHKDNNSLIRIINFPRRGIGENTILALLNKANEYKVSLYELIVNVNNYNIQSSIQTKLGNLQAILVELNNLSGTATITDFVTKLVTITGIEQLYSTQSEEDINRTLNIEQFIQSVKSFESNNEGATIADYLQSVTLQNGIDESALDGNSVTVSTIHASKGLEFQYVFIIGAEEGIFPLSRAMDNPDELEEERRLMYVAVTRAKKRVFLSLAKSRFLYGRRQYTEQSKFLGEMELGKVEKQFSTGYYDYDNNSGSHSDYYANAPKMPKQTQNFTPTKVTKVNDSWVQDNVMWQDKLKTQSNKYDEYKVGVTVLHPKFGIGTIVKSENVSNNCFVSVDFKGIGVKSLSLSFAPLQIIKKKE